MWIYLWVGAATLLSALLLTPLAMRVAHGMDWVDRPGLRKIHGRPVAYLGGAAMFGALCLGFLVLLLLVNRPSASIARLDSRMLSVLGGAALLFAVGLVDDVRGVRPRLKLGAQVFAAASVCASGIMIERVHLADGFVIEFGALSCLVTVFWIVGITNAVNLIDGMDGLATGLCAVACAAIGWTAYQSGLYTAAILMVAVLGALLGFLPYNLNPAKIFMGDAGSMVLGFLLSSTAVLCAAKTATIVGIGLPLVALGIPIFDTLFAMVRRRLEGRSMFSADRNHIHHRLLALGYGQTSIVLLLCAETALAVSLVILSSSASNGVVAAIVIGGLCLHVMVFRVFGAIRFRASIAGFSRLAVSAQHAKAEKLDLDELELQFREANSIQDWWQAVTKAGQQLGLLHMELELETRADRPPLVLGWDDESAQPPPSAPLVRLSLPVRQRRSGCPTSIEVTLPAAGSLEEAGRHVAQLCRLLDHHSIAELPAVPAAEPDVPQEPADLPTLEVIPVHRSLAMSDGPRLYRVGPSGFETRFSDRVLEASREREARAAKGPARS